MLTTQTLGSTLGLSPRGKHPTASATMPTPAWTACHGHTVLPIGLLAAYKRSHGGHVCVLATPPSSSKPLGLLAALKR